MSYDIRLAVRVEGAPVNEDGEPLYAVIDEPELASPTYNLGDMFRACTGWDYEQGKFYRVSEVLPLIEKGIHELRFNGRAYKKYEPDNGWGSIGGALEALESMLECIEKNGPGNGWNKGWNEIPLDCLYIAW